MVYLSSHAVNVQLHHVLATGVVLWFTLLVLGVHDAGGDGIDTAAESHVYNLPMHTTFNIIIITTLSVSSCKQKSWVLF